MSWRKGKYEGKFAVPIGTYHPDVAKNTCSAMGGTLMTYADKEEADLILFMVDSTEPPGTGDKWIVENYLKTVKTPVL